MIVKYVVSLNLNNSLLIKRLCNLKYQKLIYFEIAIKNKVKYLSYNILRVNFLFITYNNK